MRRGLAEPAGGLEARIRPAKRRVEVCGERAQLLARGTEFGHIAHPAPQPDARMRDGEILAQVVVELVEHGREGARGEQRNGQPVHLLADDVVLLAELDQLGELALERARLVAQRDDLAIGERDRLAAVRVRHVDLGSSSACSSKKTGFSCR